MYRLRFQLIVILIAVVLVAVGTMAGLAWYNTRSAFTHFISVNTDTQRARLEQSVVRFIQETDDVQTIQPFVDEMSYMTGVDIQVIDDVTGETLLFSGHSSDNVQWLQHDVASLDEQETIRVFSFQRIPAGEEADVTVQFQPLPVASSNILLSPAQVFNENLRQLLTISALVAGGAAVTMGIAVSGAIAKPILVLTEAAQQLKQGNLDLEIPTRGRGEIAELTRAFNNMAATLRDNERLRQNMVSDVAHELRTPVTNIRGYIEAIQDGILPCSVEQLGLLHEEVLQISHLIDDLQQLSLAESGKLPMSFSPVDVAHVIDQVITSWIPRANEHNVHLAADIPVDLPIISADRQRLIQILNNLLSNAIKYSPENGYVRIGVRQQGDHLSIVVFDNGPGIKADDLPHVFERFYRVDHSRNRATGGTGLGLAITRQLVLAHGGSVHVRSIPNQETSFTVLLPLKPVALQLK